MAEVDRIEDVVGLDEEASKDSLANEAMPTEAQPKCATYASIAVAMVGAAMFGLDQGNFGNVQGFESFREDWCLHRYGEEHSCSEEGSVHNVKWQDDFVLWGAVLITIGATAGALLLGPPLMNRCGRRPCVGIGGAICFFGCLLASYLSVHSVIAFFHGRFITGFGVGVSCFALPVYNAELSTASIRGATGTLFQLNVMLGCFAAVLITLVDKDWYFGMMLPGLAGAVLAVSCFFIPESPRYVMEKKGYDAGFQCLSRVRAGDVHLEAQEILTQIQEEKDIENVTFLGLFRERNLRKRVFIACTLVVGQQATGVNAFLGYAATIFRSIGIDNPIEFNVIFNSIMIIGCVAGLLLVDSKYGGRRSQLLIASALMGPPLILAGLALHFNWPGMITMVCVIIYGVGFQFAWGSIPWIYPAEIFSMAEKGAAVSLAVGMNYISNAVVIFITPYLMQWSVPGTLFFFGALNLLNAMFVYFYIKETKGVPLESIPDLFGEKARGRKLEEKSSSEMNC
eukprot:CAMPEP_0197628950 /NCGR_PEP_ID=MMETSP1338-20131121/7021_1 /TAXON_ID=43686 ORGANISM="Pelagodinium beii, Strain RCC1491" /NCGR_SAMPLE_ID=MMETSP1338 /ASSEMBLY_ACC=CAM_ASM_000754 /LENGTH=510 /DNA_ID=CAMNT_0043199955 /DNA_START=44 /DNA_END=1576 /DNA_ORIENTATION=-